MSSRQMHRFLENLGSGGQGSADGRLSPRDAMERFRQSVEQHAQESRGQQERQEQYKQNRANLAHQIWQEAGEEIRNQKDGG